MPSCRAAARSGSARCWNSSPPSTSTAPWCAPRCRGSPPTAGSSATRSAATAFIGWRSRERQTFDTATRHIYDPPASDWTGRFELLLIGNGGDRDVSREALKNAGFGSPLPGVWVAPSGVPIPEEAASAIRLEVSAEDDSGRRLLSESWPLHRTADAYLKFMKTFEPLRGWLGRRDRLSDIEAFTARILLIHHYRRVVLRDPLLPTALLPADWPGRAARQLCGEIYRGVLPASEQWLDRHGTNRDRAAAGGRQGTGAPVRRLVIMLQKILVVSHILIYIRKKAFRENAHVHAGAQHVRRATTVISRMPRRPPRFRRASMPKSASSRTTGCRRPIARR